MSTPRTGAPLRLHSRCELSNYGRGEILFVGQAAFSPGVWVGIALDEPLGKNDGSVQGKRYFETEAGYGVFVRPSQVRILAPEEEEAVVEAGQAEESLHHVSLDNEAGASLLDDEQEAFDKEKGAPYSARHATSSPSKSARPASQRPPGATSQRMTPQYDVSSSAVSSRNTSPVKRQAPTSSTASRPGALRPSSVAASGASRMRAGPGTSPQKNAASSGPPSRGTASPTKTPARAPMARTNTAPGMSAAMKAPIPRGAGATSRASLAPSPAIGGPNRTPRPASSAAVGSARTSATSATPISHSSATQARQAVSASRAPDAVTARAGLRSIAKQRPSMAPPTSSAPQTPAIAGRAGVPASGSAAASRMSPAAATRSKPATARSPATLSPKALAHSPVIPPSAHSGHSMEDQDGEDPLHANVEDEIRAQFEASMEDRGPGSPASPSLRKLHGENATDHMSLDRAQGLMPAARSNAEIALLQRDLEETRARLRISEKKREEERGAVRQAESIRLESEQVLAIKPKLLSKQEELQNELKELHKQEKEWLAQKEETDRQLAELTDQVEILSLDKEFAEEKLEASAEEMQALKDRVEELELDLDVQREELARYDQQPGQGDSKEDVERSSIAVVQLEKQNERLKEALVRLRDITAESDAEQKDRISDLSKELRSLDEIQDSYESTKTKLHTTEALLEDLKIQLDDALGAEEMLEQLTERNMNLTEKNNEMQATIEELEALKELNDELEETHIETEKQLQEEIDLKELQLREHRMRSETLEANLVDYESTFAQFRELVLNLQSEVEALRDDEKTRDASKAAASADDQAMLNLNLKLQSSTLKSQAKTIELELGKLQATQALRQIDITSVYLPKRYFEQDKDAVDSLLFFQRLAAKTEVIKTIIESNHDIASSLVSIVDERLITICRMRHSLAHFIASSRQISALVQLSSIPTFLKSGHMFKELASIERRIDQYIDLLRREDLKEEECAAEFRRFVKMLEDYEFTLLDGSSEVPDSDLAAKELGSAILFELDLDSMSAALGYAKQTVAAFCNDYSRQVSQATDSSSTSSAVQDGSKGGLEMRVNDFNAEQALLEPLQVLINHLRSTKVPTRKLVRRLSTLYENSEAVKMDAIVRLPGLGKLSSELVTFATSIAASFGKYAANARTNKLPFDIADLLEVVGVAAREALGVPSAQSQTTATIAEGAWQHVSQEAVHLTHTVNELLNAATDQDNVIRVVGALPWSLRANEIREEQSRNTETQRTIHKQTEDLRDLYKQIKARDEVIEENRIKIERLAKSLQRSRQDNETVGALREDLVDANRRMKAYEDGNSALQAELEQLQRQYEQLLSQKGSVRTALEGGAEDIGAEVSAESRARSSAPGHKGAMPVSSLLPSSNYETAYLADQLEAMQGAVRHLRLENSLLKGQNFIAQVESLPMLASSRWTHAAETPNDNTVVQSTESEAKTDSQRGLPKSRKEGRGIDGSGLRRPQQSVAEVRSQAENKSLVQEWMRMTSCPRVVTLPARAAPHKPGESNADGEKRMHRRGWIPLAQLPHVQYQKQLQQRAQLRTRIDELITQGNGSDRRGTQAHMPNFLSAQPRVAAAPIRI